MKSLKSILMIVLCLMALTAQAKDDKKKTETIVYKVEMDCQSCVNKINKNLVYEKGIKDLKVDFDEQTVAITYKADKTNGENLVAAFKKLGFEAAELKEEDCSKATTKKCCGGH